MVFIYFKFWKKKSQRNTPNL